MATRGPGAVAEPLSLRSYRAQWASLPIRGRARPKRGFASRWTWPVWPSRSWTCVPAGSAHTGHVREVLGFDPENLPATFDAALRHVHPDDVTSLRERTVGDAPSRRRRSTSSSVSAFPTAPGTGCRGRRSGSPIAQGRALKIIAVGRNTSLRRARMERLGEQSALLRAVVDNLPISIYTKDREGRYVHRQCGARAPPRRAERSRRPRQDGLRLLSRRDRRAVCRRRSPGDRDGPADSRSRRAVRRSADGTASLVSHDESAARRCRRARSPGSSASAST